MREVVEGLLREHRAEMLGFVRKRAGHIVDPEDILQQAALRALAKVDQLREAERGRAWLYRIVRNVLADELRKVGIPAQAPREEETSVPAPGEDGRICSCAMSLAKTLKPEYSTILERVVLDETPVTELAHELGLTPNNATVRLHRARKALRALLEAHCGTTTMESCLDCVCDERGCCV